MERLPTSISAAASIIEELFEIDDEGFEDIEAFTLDKAEKFTAANTPGKDTGVVVPAVPDECSEETKVAGAALQSYLSDLGTSLAYQTFLQAQLQLVCDDVVVAITDLTTTATTRVDGECGPETLATLQDLWNLE